MVIPPVFDDAWHFQFPEYTWVAQNGKYGFINRKGQAILPLKYAEAYLVSKEMAEVRSTEDKSGYVDMQGNELWEEADAAPQAP